MGITDGKLYKNKQNNIYRKLKIKGFSVWCQVPGCYVHIRCRRDSLFITKMKGITSINHIITQFFNDMSTITCYHTGNLPLFCVVFDVVGISHWPVSLLHFFLLIYSQNTFTKENITINVLRWLNFRSYCLFCNKHNVFLWLPHTSLTGTD